MTPQFKQAGTTTSRVTQQTPRCPPASSALLEVPVATKPLGFHHPLCPLSLWPATQGLCHLSSDKAVALTESKEGQWADWT